MASKEFKLGIYIIFKNENSTNPKENYVIVPVVVIVFLIQPIDHLEF